MLECQVENNNIKYEIVEVALYFFKSNLSWELKIATFKIEIT